MTFLEIVQRIARDSGTVPGDNQPATLTGISGRLLSMKMWADEAWGRIQSSRSDWRWMKREFSGSTLTGEQRYAYDAMSIPTDTFSKWLVNEYHPNHGAFDFTITDPALGDSDEQPLFYRHFDDLRRGELRNPMVSQKPHIISIDWENKLVLYPTPDKAYTIKGAYAQAPTRLSADTDVPGMPAEFHDLIAYEALVHLVVFDEAPTQMAAWEAYRRRRYKELVNHQTPAIRSGGPLA